MTEDWFINPSMRTLSLSDGQSITVKERLNTGEKRRALRRIAHETADGTLRVDRLEIGLHTVTAYLLDWTVRDAAGQAVSIRGLDADAMASVLDSLDPDRFDEIVIAIDQHVMEREAARAQEKKLRAGVTNGAAISLSPSGAAGVSSGSASSTPMIMRSSSNS